MTLRETGLICRGERSAASPHMILIGRRRPSAKRFELFVATVFRTADSSDPYKYSCLRQPSSDLHFSFLSTLGLSSSSLATVLNTPSATWVACAELVCFRIPFPCPQFTLLHRFAVAAFNFLFGLFYYF